MDPEEEWGYEEEQEDHLFKDEPVWDEFTGEVEPDVLEEPPSHLVSKDYTLNSPLLPDEIDEFIKFLQEESSNRFFDRGDWEDRRRWLEEEEIEKWSTRGTQDFHSWMMGYLEREPWCDEFNTLMTMTDTDSEASFLLLSTYVEEWAKVKITFQPRRDMDERTRFMGAHHLVWHKITLMLNCSNDSEAKALETFKGVSSGKIGEDWVFRYQVDHDIQFLIGKGVVHCSYGNQLLDRHMVLLVKDLCGGRFQTYLHCEFKEYPEYKTSHLWKVKELFDAGDKVISAHGSKGYEVIAQLEPSASLRMHQIASSNRPYLPKLEKFEEHVKDTRSKLEQEYPESKEFFDILFGMNNVECLLTAFGSFRLWGHPFINYKEGLAKLKANTTMPKKIDTGYAECLASDLAYKVLHNKFQKEKKWYVDLDRLSDNHPLHTYVKNNQWPAAGILSTIGNTWHKLPLVKCFDVPDMINPTTIYADKSYSPQKSDLIRHLIENPGKPLKSLSVLKNLINRPATNWKEFLQYVNDNGLDDDDLIIALSAKEREIKDKGRFFALMSWKLREYFVVTEYLIKTHYVPLFGGLTMADDFNTVTNKLLKASQGQSGASYIEICIANHIDYSKWNNHQRAEANDPVFRVMGQFLGYPELIVRTHEFFKKSLIYYKARIDCLSYNGKEVVSDPDGLYCWNGQPGGLEGLRQKGWSIVNYLCIERQAKIRSTSIRALAQGDNQVLCTRYKLRSHRKIGELKRNLRDVFNNNKKILDSIIEGTGKLGLVINEDETLQSASMMMYGKNIVYRGSFKCLAEKRLARILCTTNDQLPSLSSVGGTVVTNCLTIGHFSDIPLNAMIQYNWLSNYSRILMEDHNPAIKGPVRTYQDRWSAEEVQRYKLYSTFLDPSLGGVSGVSPGRFLIRQFPDPVTESLSFWKLIAEKEIDDFHTQTAIMAGNPVLANYEEKHFEKLIENPNGLNLPRGLSAVTALRDRVREGLIDDVGTIGNRIIRSAICKVVDDKDRFVHYLSAIQPCFPRFISEFYSSTFMGLVEDIVGLFENSRTIRNHLKNKLGKSFDEIVIRSEITSIISLRGKRTQERTHLWSCSSSQADKLRFTSWNREILGATVPHPFELLRNGSRVQVFCAHCTESSPKSDYVAAICPVGPPQDGESRGPYSPYLGSRTSETTSIIQPWEKSTKIPIIRRSVALRDVIGWFVDRDSNLAKSILLNIERLCGIKAETHAPGYSRTGSALHRFRCSRQSNGGFSGVSPNLASWFILTTDTLQSLGFKNFDFMHQALLIYAQVTASTIQSQVTRGGTYHFHVTCIECLREISEPKLEVTFDFEFPDMSEELNDWKPEGTEWFSIKPVFDVPSKDWSKVSDDLKSFHLGRITGFCFADKLRVNLRDQLDLFPNVLGHYVSPVHYIRGIVDGLFRACSLSMTHKKSATIGRYHGGSLEGNFFGAVEQLCKDPGFLVLMESPGLRREIGRGPHRISPGYPSAREDQGESIASYFQEVYKKGYSSAPVYKPESEEVWVFSDFLSVDIAGPFVLSEEAASIYFRPTIPASGSSRLREIANLDGVIRSQYATVELLHTLLEGKKVYSTGHELRSATKLITPYVADIEVESDWEEFRDPEPVAVTEIIVPFAISPTSKPYLDVPDIRNPTISGLRLGQLATGSFYKLIAILEAACIGYKDFLCGGDGSGGCTACLLRRSITSRGIFNSLMAGANLNFKGSTPSPPPAIDQMPKWVSSRCINLTTCWEEPSDLSQPETWENFSDIKSSKNLQISLIVLDMELTSPETEVLILENLKTYGLSLLAPGGCIIYKTYIGHLYNSEVNCLSILGGLFHETQLYQTELSGSHTSEVYVLFKHQRLSHIHPIYPDWINLFERLGPLKCFQTVQQEYQRALENFNHRSLEGIPNRYLQNPRSEMTKIIRNLGVDPNFCSILADAVSLCKKERVLSMVLAILLYSGENLFPLKKSATFQTIIPSDQKLYKWMAFLLGTMTWVSLTTRNFDLYKSVHEINQGSLTFSYEVLAGPESEHQAIRWSLSQDLGNSKTLRMDSHQAGQARILRCLTRISCQRLTENWDSVERCVRMFPYAKDFKELTRNSGTLDLMSGRSLLQYEELSVGFDDEVGSDEEIEL